MGGIGSGSRGYSRARYESLRPVDLAVLMRQKPEPGATYNIRWTFGMSPEPRGITAWHVVENFGFRLRHVEFNPDGSKSETSCSLGFAVTWQRPDHPIEQLAGSGRRWFCCPGCGRACRVVYAKAGFRCRLCIRNGIYESQAESGGWRRRLHKAQKLHLRYGGSGDLSKPFPRKPRTMHWAKYRRLAARYSTLAGHVALDMSARFEPWRP